MRQEVYQMAPLLGMGKICFIFEFELWW